jgi:hypothetical protein
MDNARSIERSGALITSLHIRKMRIRIGSIMPTTVITEVDRLPQGWQAGSCSGRGCAAGCYGSDDPSNASGGCLGDR